MIVRKSNVVLVSFVKGNKLKIRGKIYLTFLSQKKKTLMKHETEFSNVPKNAPDR